MAPRLRRTALLVAVAALSVTGGNSAMAEDDAGAPPSTAPDRGAGASPAEAGAPSASPADIDRWVAELAHDEYEVRSLAAKRLLAAGEQARAKLQSAAESFDPEVRAAATRLIVLIAQDDFGNRLAAFAADVGGSRGATMPGWDAFRKYVGDGQEARSLFVEMQRQEGKLIAELFDPAKEDLPTADDEVVEQLEWIRGGLRPGQAPWEHSLMRRLAWSPNEGTPSESQLGSCATLLFLGTVPEGRISDTGATQLAYLTQQAPLKTAIATGPHQEPIRKLLAAWVFHCPNKSEEVLRQRLEVAALNELREAISLALAVSHGDPQYLTVHPITRSSAIMLVGQFGGPEHIAHLEPLLEDDSLCLQTRVIAGGNLNGMASPASVQVRDVALATMLHLSGQSPTDYGYTSAVRQPPRLFNLASLYMESDEKRKAAIEKWQTWRNEEKRADSSAPKAEPKSS